MSDFGFDIKRRSPMLSALVQSTTLSGVRRTWAHQGRAGSFRKVKEKEKSLRCFVY